MKENDETENKNMKENDETENKKKESIGTTSPKKKKKILKKIATVQNEDDDDPIEKPTRQKKPKIEKPVDEDDPIESVHSQSSKGDDDENENQVDDGKNGPIFDEDPNQDDDAFINDVDTDSQPMGLGVLMAKASSGSSKFNRKKSPSGDSPLFFKNQYNLSDAFSIFCQYLVSCIVDKDFSQAAKKMTAKDFSQGLPDFKRAILQIQYPLLDKKKQLIQSELWTAEVRTWVETMPNLGTPREITEEKPCDICRRAKHCNVWCLNLGTLEYDSEQLWDPFSYKITGLKDIESPIVLYAGKTCHKRTSLYHAFHHYKYNLIKILQQKVKMISVSKKISKEDENGQSDQNETVSAIVNDKQFISRLFSNYFWLIDKSSAFIKDSSEPDSLKEKVFGERNKLFLVEDPLQSVEEISQQLEPSKPKKTSFEEDDEVELISDKLVISQEANTKNEEKIVEKQGAEPSKIITNDSPAQNSKLKTTKSPKKAPPMDIREFFAPNDKKPSILDEDDIEFELSPTNQIIEQKPSSFSQISSSSPKKNLKRQLPLVFLTPEQKVSSPPPAKQRRISFGSQHPSILNYFSQKNSPKMKKTSFSPENEEFRPSILEEKVISISSDESGDEEIEIKGNEINITTKNSKNEKKKTGEIEKQERKKRKNEEISEDNEEKKEKRRNNEETQEKKIEKSGTSEKKIEKSGKTVENQEKKKEKRRNSEEEPEKQHKHHHHKKHKHRHHHHNSEEDEAKSPNDMNETSLDLESKPENVKKIEKEKQDDDDDHLLTLDIFKSPGK